MSNFKIGDIITAYHKGYHVITGFDGHLLKYEKVLSDKLTKVGRTKNTCDKAWCRKVDPQLLLNQLKESEKLVREVFKL